MKKLIVLFFITAICFAFVTVTQKFSGDEPEYIPPTKQRTGNAATGYTYLITGDYIKSGIPYSLFFLGSPKDTNNFLQRNGNNESLRYDFTAVKAPNGELVVAPNCLQCHAQLFEGKLVIGLGNSFSDYTVDRQPTALMAENYLVNVIGENSKKYLAAKNFIRSIKTVAPNLITTTKGVNLADALGGLLAAHRNPKTLQWIDKSSFNLPKEAVPTDVPAWWLLKKKNAMFYNGFGRGDFARFSMVSNLLTVSGIDEAREVDSHFNDVLAYINSIIPPKYPRPVDTSMASEGKTIFMANCEKCHGSYGEDPSYPNLLIPENIIRTDSALYTANYSNPKVVDWFNNSWFSTGEHAAKLVPYRGYIAPPLDGIWITAPYMHNGSVPNLEGMLNSKARPKYWKRDFANPGYNYIIPGCNFDKMDEPGSNEVYNTTLKGYSNEGHYFGDHLSVVERRSLIEYLKTL